MKIDIKHAAQLANLSLSDEELKKFDSQLTKILEYIETLEKVDTKNILPTSQVTGLNNVSRKDEETTSSLSQEEVLSNTDLKYNGLFKVKAIFNK